MITKIVFYTNLLIITEDIASEEKAEWFGDKATIKFIPLWKWLLG